MNLIFVNFDKIQIFILVILQSEIENFIFVYQIFYESITCKSLCKVRIFFIKNKLKIFKGNNLNEIFFLQFLNSEGQGLD